MKRILWHGIGPWHKTGYGVQCALFAPRLAALGYEVVIARMGAGVEDDTRHPDFTTVSEQLAAEGIRIIGGGLGNFGLPPPLAIKAAFGGHDPDLVLVLKDAWVLDPLPYRRYNTAVWVNIDCEPMGEGDRMFFETSGARPIAVSKFGVSVMRGDGLDPAYVPHGINTGYFTPGPQGESRDLLGIPRAPFVAGMNAANLGKVPRKAFYEQFAAFAEFKRRLQPKAILLCHTVPQHPEGIDLRRLAAHLGIADSVAFGGNMNQRPLQMVNWYRSLDVLLSATYGEGFGIPVVEAMACGIPVIVTDCTALPEKIHPGSGWVVTGQKFWNENHGACWTVPSIGQITAKLAVAQAQRHTRNRNVLPRQAAELYDADAITRAYWKPVLEELIP